MTFGSAYRIHGTAKNPIRITIMGDAGMGIGKDSEYIDLTFEDEIIEYLYRDYPHTKYIGEKISDSRIVFKDDSSESCLRGAKNSIIIYHKEPGSHNVNEVENCNIYVLKYGLGRGYNFGINSIHCNFYSPYKETLDKIRNNSREGCNFYLLNNKETEKIFGGKK